MPAGIENFDSMFSVRAAPWHGRGVVLDDYPASIEEALEKSGLSWKVRQGQILVADEDGDPSEVIRVARIIAEMYDRDGTVPSPGTLERLLAAVQSGSNVTLADGFRANRREDTGDVLGVVSDDYRVVQNESAFRFLDALIASELHFETAGSLYNGKRVWVLARLPEFVEVGGDEISTFLYVANSHDGSLAVTAATTPVRIVCANTLGLALRQSERNAARTYKFRHTGDLQLKFEEARQVIGMTVNYEKQFKELGDQLALLRFSTSQMIGVAEKLFPIDRDSMGERAVKNREENRDRLVSTFLNGGPDGDTRGNAPGSKWCAVNAVAEYADWMRRTTKRTDQMSRSFEDSAMKQMGFEAILAA